ncbi:EamA family transporter [Pedobacter nyackensis]|uniref:Chloramphenicol-sensitive protein RarD n=1 Tax=Pedobacter nyackensis TaxID=475255 RepID=A0A1W2BIV7_9SPHI|nr:EamA family transporter [Pedobacter nyackensis]SMC72700.1 chloramphenicol-sensitive protein RarD [Pedobacter nyackensis]
MPKSNLRYFFAGILSFAIWGFFSIPLRNLKAFPSEEILYYRIFTSLVFIWVAILIFRRKHLKSDLAYLSSVTTKEKRNILLQLVGSTLLLTSNWYTYIYAVNNVSLQSAAFAYMVCPLITAFGGYLILKESLSGLKLISLGIALLSILLLATGSFVEVLWSVVIASLYAFYLIIQRKMQNLDKLNVLAVQIGLAVILMLPFYLLKHEGIPQGLWFWGNITVIAVFFTIIPLFMSLYALIGIPSSTLGIIIYINPIIAFAVAIFYFGEHVDAHKLFAYLLLLVSVIVFNWSIIKDIFTFKGKPS